MKTVVLKTQCSCGCKSLAPIAKLQEGMTYSLRLANCLSCKTTLAVEKIYKKLAA